MAPEGTAPGSPDSRRRVVAYVPDLMDASRLRSAAASVELEPVRSPAALAAAAVGADLVVVDLSRAGVIDRLPAIAAAGAPVVGFGPHVDHELLETATAAGCHEVVPRSAFFRSLPARLAGL